MKNFSHTVWIIFRTAACLSLLPVALWARVELRTVSASGSTVAFSFSELPRSAVQELSSNKTQIVLRIADAVASDKAREGIKPTESVELVSMQQKGNELIVYIMLRKKAGCTQVMLPYSRALQLHIVEWDKLRTRDNLYHSGLLSLDSGVPATARTSFKRAANAGSGDAAAVLGINLTAEGNIDEAERELRRATDLGTSIGDVYAALADIAAYRNDTVRVRQYAEQFKRRTGIESFPSQLGHLPKETTVLAEPQTFAQSLLVEEPIDSTTIAAIPADTARTDSALNAAVSQQARALLPDSTDREAYNGSTSLVPSWMKWAVFAFIALIGLVLTAIVALYMRWRKKQMQPRKSAESPAASAQAPTAFEAEVAQAIQAATARRATDVYSRSTGDESLIAEQQADGQHENSSIQPVEPQPPQRHWMDEAEDEHDESIPAYEATNNIPETDDTHASDTMDALAQKLRRGRGELELAVKLIARKKQDGKDKAHALPPEEIPGKPGQLSRLAGSLGVGTGELEIKRNLSAARDGERAEKMRSLFGSDSTAQNS